MGAAVGRFKQLKVSLCVALTDISGRAQFWVIHHLSKQARTEKPAWIVWLKINLCSPIFLLIFCMCIKDLPPAVKKVHVSQQSLPWLQQFGKSNSITKPLISIQKVTGKH